MQKDREDTKLCAAQSDFERFCHLLKPAAHSGRQILRWVWAANTKSQFSKLCLQIQPISAVRKAEQPQKGLISLAWRHTNKCQWDKCNKAFPAGAYWFYLGHGFRPKARRHDCYTTFLGNPDLCYHCLWLHYKVQKGMSCFPEHCGPCKKALLLTRFLSIFSPWSMHSFG